MKSWTGSDKTIKQQRIKETITVGENLLMCRSNKLRIKYSKLKLSADSSLKVPKIQELKTAKKLEKCKKA